jgi:hypothetical protein
MADFNQDLEANNDTLMHDHIQDLEPGEAAIGVTDESGIVPALFEEQPTVNEPAQKMPRLGQREHL